MNPLLEIAFRVWYLTGWEPWYYNRFTSTKRPDLNAWFILHEFRCWKANDFTLPPQ